MPTDTKQLTADEVLERLEAIHEFHESYPEEWRSQLARDMNRLVGRAIWWLETDRDETDVKFGAAVLRVVERVAEFEYIEKKGKHDV